MSEFDTTPARLNFPSIKQGDTMRAMVFSATGTTANLSRVRCKVKDSDGVMLLNLDSDATGIVINTATAGAWQYTISQIAAATTATLASGSHNYDIETTDADGIVETHFEGCWVIRPQVTD